MIFYKKLLYALYLLFPIFLDGVGGFPNEGGCNSTLFRKSGTFWSPTYYNQSQINDIIKCYWRISAAADEKIILNITNIDLEKTLNCTTSYVEVRDGYWYNSPFIERLCGSDKDLNLVTSTSNKLLISYVDENPNGHRGFTANYESICGENLFVEKNFTLKSHKSLHNYHQNKKCIWNIVVPESHKIIVTFEKFQLEYEKNCLYDYVEILDGLASNSTSLGVFCGNTSPPEMISSSNSLMIKFISDNSVQKKGFLATITTEYDECGTPEHECAHECINTMGKYRCSCRSGYELHSDGKKCEIACGGALNFSSGVIMSPSFPELYPPNKDCTWEILTTPEKLLVLEFTYFDLEGKNFPNTKKAKCRKDKLQVFDEETILGSYCGNLIPDPVVSDSNFMKIIFTSDNRTEKTGFVLNYTTLTNKCLVFNGNCHHKCVTTSEGFRKCECSDDYVLTENGFDCKKDPCFYKITAVSGYVYSPDYPDDYPPYQNCTWHFKTTPGHTITIEFLVFDVQYGDYVSLYDGPFSNFSELATLIDEESGTVVTSTDNEMYMVFVTTSNSSYRGFEAEYYSVCGGTFYANPKEKYIFSHDQYGIIDYYSNTSCDWTILPYDGFNTSLSIEAIDIEDSSDCLYDFVEIFDDDLSLGKFCGTSKPAKEFIIENHATIEFRSDDDVKGEGFRIMYKAVNQ